VKLFAASLVVIISEIIRMGQADFFVMNIGKTRLRKTQHAGKVVMAAMDVAYAVYLDVAKKASFIKQKQAKCSA